MANYNENLKEHGFNWPVVIKNGNGHANLDYFYGPYDDLSEVPDKMRVPGFTCAIMENGAPVEYWWTGTGWEPKGLPKDTYVKFKGVKDSLDALNDTVADMGDMYLVPVRGSSGVISEYKEYIRVEGRWEMLGSRAAGVSGTLSFVNADSRVTTLNANGKEVVTDSYNGTQNVTLDLDMSKYLGKAEAGETYLTKNAASETYLTKNEAGDTYLTKDLAGSTYVTKSEAANITNAIVNGKVGDGKLTLKSSDGTESTLFTANQSKASTLDLSGLATKTEVASSISEAVTAVAMGDNLLALDSNGNIVKRNRVNGEISDAVINITVRDGDTVYFGNHFKFDASKNAIFWRQLTIGPYYKANNLALVIRYDKDSGVSALYNPGGRAVTLEKEAGKNGWYTVWHHMGTRSYTVSYIGCGVSAGTASYGGGKITYYEQSFCTVQQKNIDSMLITTGNNETTDDALWFELSFYDLRSYAE